MTKSSRFIIIVLIELIAGSSTVMYAQDADLLPAPRVDRSLLRVIGEDIAHVFTAPFRMNRQDGYKLLALGAVTTVFVTSLDGRIDDNFREGEKFLVRPATRLAGIGERYDEISSPFLVIGLGIPLVASGLAFDSPELVQTTRLMIESFLISGLITQLGKRTFGRARPFTDEGPHDFRPFRFAGSNSRHALPSGHTSSAFAIATVFAKQHPKWWVQLPAYTVAVSVALQRIDSRNHWGGDVILGAAIGYSVASTLVNKHQERSDDGFVTAYVAGNRAGVLLRF